MNATSWRTEMDADSARAEYELGVREAQRDEDRAGTIGRGYFDAWIKMNARDRAAFALRLQVGEATHVGPTRDACVLALALIEAVS